MLTKKAYNSYPGKASQHEIKENKYMKEFEGKTAVITGAASGIGKALAERVCTREDASSSG